MYSQNADITCNSGIEFWHKIVAHKTHGSDLCDLYIYFLQTPLKHFKNSKENQSEIQSSYVCVG